MNQNHMIMNLLKFHETLLYLWGMLTVSKMICPGILEAIIKMRRWKE